MNLLTNKIRKLATIFGIFIFFFTSCDKAKTIIEKTDILNVYHKKYFKNGELSYIETFYKDKLYSIYKIHDKNGLRNDTLFQYELNDTLRNKTNFYTEDLFYCVRMNSEGIKLSEGYMYKYRYNGWWKIYNKNGKLTHKKYIIGRDTSKYNYSQIISFDENNNIILSKSNFVRVLLPDTLYMGKSMGNIVHNPNLKDHLAYYVGIGYNLDPDFNNISDIRVDTFTIEKEKSIGFDFKNSGKNKIKGFIYEKALEEDKKSLSLKVLSTITYFEKEFYVIPRPDSIPKNKVIYYD